MSRRMFSGSVHLYVFVYYLCESVILFCCCCCFSFGKSRCCRQKRGSWRRRRSGSTSRPLLHPRSLIRYIVATVIALWSSQLTAALWWLGFLWATTAHDWAYLIWLRCPRLDCCIFLTGWRAVCGMCCLVYMLSTVESIWVHVEGWNLDFLKNWVCSNCKM